MMRKHCSDYCDNDITCCNMSVNHESVSVFIVPQALC